MLSGPIETATNSAFGAKVKVLPTCVVTGRASQGEEGRYLCVADQQGQRWSGIQPYGIDDNRMAKKKEKVITSAVAVLANEVRSARHPGARTILLVIRSILLRRLGTDS
jgi:hypothetical protein